MEIPGWDRGIGLKEQNLTLCLYGLYERRPTSPWVGQPFYVGIGSLKRPAAHLSKCRRGQHRNSGVQSIFDEHIKDQMEPEARILAILPNREYACETERKAIAVFGKRADGGCLVNVAAGGDGPDPALMQNPEIIAKISAAAKAQRLDPEHVRLHLDRVNAAIARPGWRAKVSQGTKAALHKPDVRAKHLEGLKRANAAQSAEERSRIQREHYAQHPARRARVSEAMKERLSRPGVLEELGRKSTASDNRTWADPVVRARRIAGMRAFYARRREAVAK